MKSLASPNKKTENLSQKYLLSPQANRQEEYNENWSYSFNGKKGKKVQAERQYSSIRQKKDEKVQYEMRGKQKEMIASLSKIFLAQNPRPQKILVKIKQMKRCQLQQQHHDNCPNCRIDRIQISTLPETYKSSNPKLNSFQDIPQISDIVLDLKVPLEMESSIIQINDLSCSLSPQKKLRQLSIRKVLAIKYQPQKSNSDNSRMRSANQIAFSKFRKPVHDSLQSNLSINNETLLDELNGESTNPSKDANFTKLLELSSFMKRKNIEKQLLIVSTAANEKFANEYKHLKSQLNSQRLMNKSKIQQLTKEIQKTKDQLQQQKSAKNQLNTQLAAFEKKLKEIRQINEVFLKQNNTLKEKLKENLKIVQEFRKDITKQSNIESAIQEKSRPNSPRLITRYNEKTMDEGLKKAISVVNSKSQNRQTEKSPKGNKISVEPQNHYLTNFGQELNKQGQKPSNFRSTQVLSRGYEAETQKQIPSKEVSVKSQRIVGIRKNSPRVDPSSMQQKNMVKVASYSDFQDHNNSNMMYSSKNERQNKSLSNYSSLSGSLSQRVGYLQKPVTEAKKGMLVDYMLEDMVERNDLQQKPSRALGKQEKPINIRVSEVQRERFQFKNAK